MTNGNSLSRRGFLRLASLLPLAWSAQGLFRSSSQPDAGSPNIIILVLDAWSARHLQIYGYPRNTMPNLERFAENSTVFHKHYSTATFTVPGTASLLTGVHPWTHRALNLGSGGVSNSQVEKQIFNLLSATHSTIGYAQNKFADIFLWQMSKNIDTHIRAGEFNLEHRYIYDSPMFQGDAVTAYGAFENNIFQDGGGRDASLFLGPLFRAWKLRERNINNLHLKDEYPRGLPDSTEQFLLGDVVDGTINALKGLVEPAFAYFHFHAPHDPYRPSHEFYKKFGNDGWRPPNKPTHRLVEQVKSYKMLRLWNQYYDEYLLNLDAELGRLFQYLKDSGLEDRSHIVITSDHGELFERGELGHFTSMLFDPVIHVPLIISSPGQKGRQDIRASTSSVDVLPTLAYLSGNPVPDWAEGKLLPFLGGIEDSDRSVYSMDAKRNPSFAPLTDLSLGLTKNEMRLTYYNYGNNSQFELYDLQDDPEELNDLFVLQPAIAKKMKDELLEKLSEANRPFAS